MRCKYCALKEVKEVSRGKNSGHDKEITKLLSFFKFILFRPTAAVNQNLCKQTLMYCALNCILYSVTYLLTPWCRVLLEKLTGLQLVKKFPAFHGTRRFITALKSVRHLSLSWARPIQSIYPHPTSWRSVLIVTHLRLGLPSGLFPSGFPTKTLYPPLSSHICATCLAHLIFLDFISTLLGNQIL